MASAPGLPFGPNSESPAKHPPQVLGLGSATNANLKSIALPRTASWYEQKAVHKPCIVTSGDASTKYTASLSAGRRCDPIAVRKMAMTSSLLSVDPFE